MEMNKGIEWMDELLLFREEWNKSVDLSDLCDLVFFMKKNKKIRRKKDVEYGNSG